ncbi:hypothetical protein AAHE18_07G185800 [Arachis hypogaea]
MIQVMEGKALRCGLPVRRRGRNGGDRVSSEGHGADSDLVEIERELEERDAGNRARYGEETTAKQRFHREEKRVSVRRRHPLSVTIPAATASSGRGEEFGDGRSCCLLLGGSLMSVDELMNRGTGVAFRVNGFREGK